LLKKVSLEKELKCIELYVAVSWTSSFDNTDLIKEKYGFLELIYSEKYFDEDTGENFIKEDFVLDLKE